MSAKYEPLDPSEPPLSPSMETAFLEAFADISDLDDVLVTTKAGAKQCWPGSEDTDAVMSLRMATRTHSDSDDASQKKKTLISSKKSTDPKRAKRSAIEKKSRQRRQNIILHMQKEVNQLENVYADMSRKLVQWNGLGNWRSAHAMDELQQKYSELTLVAHALEEDQATLRRLLQEHDCYQRYTKQKTSEDTGFAIWDSGVPRSLSFAAKFRPLSMSEAYAIVRKTYEEIRKFTECEIVESTRSSFMGWTDQHKGPIHKNLEPLS
ncbi:hypothetical protein ON010_g16174 [Phytophthora cinnamomi]|nr:hypothetical protein ON010_g16174 [Phytophthora cinnamomi]